MLQERECGLAALAGDGRGTALVLVLAGGDAGLPFKTDETRLDAELLGDGAELLLLLVKGAMGVLVPSGMYMHRSPLGHSPDGQASPLLWQKKFLL